MPIERVGIDDSRLEDYRNVRDPESLRRRGLFVAEGRLVVERLLERSECYDVKSFLLNEPSFASLEPLLEKASGVPIYVCPTAELESIVGFNLHRGCLAIANRPRESTVAEVISRATTVVVLEAIADADNVGAVFRNASAFGGGVVLSPTCCDPLYRKAIRTSMGAVFRTPFARAREWPGDLARIRHAGFTLAALTPREPATPLEAFAGAQRPRKIALMVGTEGRGLSEEADAVADVRIRIAMQPGVDSLNLATAAAIALYQLTV